MKQVYRPGITIIAAILGIFLITFHLGQRQAESFNLLARDINPAKLGLIPAGQDLVDTMGIGAYFAVIVGIADYPGSFNDLSYTDDDALELREALLRYSNWQPGNIQLLMDSEATVSNIENAIALMGEGAAENDICLFYFSGHGTNKTDQPPYDEADGRDEFLCAYDDDICDDQISQWLGRLPTSNVVVIVDTCFSGGQMKGEALNQRARFKSIAGTTGTIFRGDGFAADLRKPKNAKDLGSTTNAGCIVLTACDDNELSVELSSISNGLFTYFVLLAIENKYDFNYDGTLSAEELSIGTLWSFWLMYSRNPMLYSVMGQMPQYLDDFPPAAPFAAELPLCF